MQYSDLVKKMKPQDIINFIFFPVVNEGCRVIKEKIVDKASDLDVASFMAMGFPAPRGGIIFWADTVGAKTICTELEKLAAAMPAVAGFFEPCDYVKQCAASGSKLADGPGARARL
jgi:enoyl-CoA hydratase/3-hydroxyacyl-CoA dehydrogenase